MLKTIRGAIGKIFIWIIVAIIVFFILRLITIMVPAFSQNNLTDYFSGKNSDGTDQKKSWLHFPYPGEWASSGVSGNTPKKLEPVRVPTIDEYVNQQTNVNNIRYQNQYIYESKPIIMYTNNSNSNNDWNNQTYTDWNSNSTDWNEGQTDWNSSMTDWNKPQTDWNKKTN